MRIQVDDFDDFSRRQHDLALTHNSFVDDDEFGINGDEFYSDGKADDRYDLLWNGARYELNTPRARRALQFLRLLSFVLYGILLIFGMVLIAAGGFAVGSGLASLLPKHFPAEGLFVVGICLVFTSGLGVVASFSKKKILILVTIALVLILVIAQFVLGVKAAAMGSDAWVDELDVAWRATPIATRIQIENSFDCCGFTSETEQIPPGWNEICADPNRETCCELPPLFDTPSANMTQHGVCAADQTRIECCGLPDTCVYADQPTCYDATTSFLEEKLSLISAMAITFTLIEILGVIVSFVLVRRIWSQKDFVYA
eukprot:TRINITY_DN1453_c0_g1_i1.p1 TRINITY_DN1453_c0_g1~~TRINITY_DN1453_c0_g1_i1.p1  ORF type:complete len:327 (-),score=94.18 TRINITY_DN1453_c0_g1_i1:68-1009(-)